MNICQAGHLDHDLVRVEVNPSGTPFSIYVYDAETYRDTRGYCSGDDALSRAVIESGMWEKWDTVTLSRRNVFKGNMVIDVGAHVGWYSLIAASNGCAVFAFEGDAENVNTLRRNAEVNGFDNIVVKHDWIGPGWSPSINDFDTPIDLVKVDIEGKDAYAVDGIWPHVESGQVSNLLVEISPVFSPGYPELVQKICEAGFNADVLGQHTFSLPSYEWIEDCHQVDILFSRK